MTLPRFLPDAHPWPSRASVDYLPPTPEAPPIRWRRLEPEVRDAIRAASASLDPMDEAERERWEGHHAAR